MGRRDKKPEDSAGIGALLRLLRQRNNISLTDMARKTKKTKGYLSAIENGHEKASDRVIDAYAEALGLEGHTLQAALEAARVAADSGRFGMGLALGPLGRPEDLEQLLVLAREMKELQQNIRNRDAELHKQMEAMGQVLEDAQDLLSKVIGEERPK